MKKQMLVLSRSLENEMSNQLIRIQMGRSCCRLFLALYYLTFWFLLLSISFPAAYRAFVSFHYSYVDIILSLVGMSDVG